MSRIHGPGYTAEPILPRCSVFEYLFPTGQASYPSPDPKGVAYIDAPRLGTEMLGLKRGDVACVYGMNSLEWVNAAMGCQAAGIIVSPTNYGSTPSELLYQLVDSTAKIIFIQPVLLPTLQKALYLPNAPKFPDNRIILLCRRPDKSDGRFTGPKAFNLCHGNQATRRPRRSFAIRPEQPVGLKASRRLRKGQDVFLGILPFGPMYGLTLLLHQPLTVGFPVVVQPRFEEISVLTAIQRYRITWALVVPPVLIALLHSKNVPRFDLSSLRGML
ncbi:hypothetical protein EHS25_005552 [Saitozyma podzolica]|uniref:AMP-dependent synthetase/ligase domain-containing protein n=1 Tax=Saitozyma podzolica TaxID=1890683 RepID=A0A427XXP8_9TREE|nr:hypothetical protein EHS25_005552 [Saitozyma podzolica]